jgi:hypothetical protein
MKMRKTSGTAKKSQKIKQNKLWLLLFILGLVLIYIANMLIMKKYIPAFIKILLFLAAFTFLFIGIIKAFWDKRKEVLLFFVTVFVMLVIFEIFLRVSACDQKIELVPAKYLFKHTPNTKECFRLMEGGYTLYKANNEGFLDEDFKAGQPAVYLLGDSFAECQRSPIEKCAHSLLEKDLSKYYNETIPVNNFGVSNYGTLNELGILQEYQNKYPPKMIIMYFLPHNDPADNLRYSVFDYNSTLQMQKRGMLKPKLIDFAIDKFDNILARFSPAMYVKKNYHATAEDNYKIYLKEEASIEAQMDLKWNLTYAAIDQIKMIADDKKIPFIIVIATGPEQLYASDWEKVMKLYPFFKGKEMDFEKPNRILKTYAEKKNIPVLDLLPIFLNSTVRLHFEKDGHWNEEGERLAEKSIYNYILENNLLK